MATFLRFTLGGLTLSVFGLLCFTFFIGNTDRAEAAFQYTSSETAYLHKLTPILTEFSQVGEKVSMTAINLQSAPAETCKNEFEFYQSVVGSLMSRLNSIAPPPRLKPMHIKSLEGMSNYMTGLNLYGSSCVDKDYAMRTKLVNRGTEYITQADQQIIEVNEMIANPDLIPAETSSGDVINEWCGVRWANNIQMEQHCVATQTEAKNKLGQMLQMHPKGTPGSVVIAECTSLWTDRSGSYNYRMIVFCAQNKIGN